MAYHINSLKNDHHSSHKHNGTYEISHAQQCHRDNINFVVND